MPAYMIVIAKISDRDAFLAGYAPKAAALVDAMGGRYVLRAPGALGLEGDFGDGASVVISQWPDRARALAFWNSPDYAAIRSLRQGIATCQVLVVDGPALA